MYCPHTNENEQSDHVWEAYQGPFRQTTSFKSHRKQTSNNFHQQEHESTAHLHTILTVLLDKCNYNHCCMSIRKIDLFIHAVKYFAIRFWAWELQADLAYDHLLDKAKSHETAVA